MAESNEAGIWFIPFSGTSMGNMTGQVPGMSMIFIPIHLQKLLSD